MFPVGRAVLERKTGRRSSIEIFENAVDLTKLAVRWGGVDFTAVGDEE
jgi:hypothetical protein